MLDSPLLSGNMISMGSTPASHSPSIDGCQYKAKGRDKRQGSISSPNGPNPGPTAVMPMAMLRWRGGSR